MYEWILCLEYCFNTLYELYEIFVMVRLGQGNDMVDMYVAWYDMTMDGMVWTNVISSYLV